MLSVATQPAGRLPVHHYQYLCMSTSTHLCLSSINNDIQEKPRMKLFTKIADLSNHTGPLAHLADRLLSRVAPQQTGTAIICSSWEYRGCCTGRSIQYRRFCISGGHDWYEYDCVSINHCYS